MALETTWTPGWGKAPLRLSRDVGTVGLWPQLEEILEGDTITRVKRAEPSCECGHPLSDDEGLDTQRMVRPVVFACDESYAMQLATALRSAVDANRSGQP